MTTDAVASDEPKPSGASFQSSVEHVLAVPAGGGEVASDRREVLGPGQGPRAPGDLKLVRPGPAYLTTR